MNIASLLNKGLSLLVAAAMVVLMVADGYAGPEIFKLVMGLIAILAFIWFGNELGSMTGYHSHGSYVNTETPGWMVCGMGWFLLVGVPIVGYLLSER